MHTLAARAIFLNKSPRRESPFQTVMFGLSQITTFGITKKSSRKKEKRNRTWRLPYIHPILLIS